MASAASISGTDTFMLVLASSCSVFGFMCLQYKVLSACVRLHLVRLRSTECFAKNCKTIFEAEASQTCYVSSFGV